MRAWDNWNSYLDNDRNLLHGKIRFCKKGTTEDVVIYNRDGIAIRNPSFTDILGRTEYQVFLENADNVSAYFYKYIGTGDMMQWQGEDYDPTRWAYQYSSDNMDPVNTVDLEATSAEGVATMADLRERDPSTVPTVNGARLLWLYGYYDAGDTSPVLYVWNSASVASDNGGSVIMPNSVPGRGRWILASREYIFDVRHFGVRATASKYATDFSYTSQISNCADYCVNEGLNAWFPDLPNSTAYYMFDGSNTFSITGDIYCSDAVRFVCKTGTSGTAIQCHELHKAAPYLFESDVQTGSATLTADYVNISWVGGNCTGNARIGWVIDADDYPRIITGKEVHFKVNGNSSLQLNNCQITSNKKITGPITIQNSILKTEYFADDYDWSDLVSIGNTILLENCKDANTYILLKNKQYESNYGDLGEQSIDADIRAGGTLENCVGTVRALSHGNFEFHNVSLNISGMAANDNLNCVDSWLTLGEDTVISTLQLRRGALNGSSLRVLSDSFLDTVDIQSPITSLGASLTISNSNISGYITAGNLSFENNQVYSEVSQTDVSGVVNVHCVGNTFHLGSGGLAARHYVHADTAGSIVRGEWRGNGSSYDTLHWIRLDRTNLNPSDFAHAYRYVGNSEPYLRKYSGLNYRMHFAGYRGNKDDGRGIFETTATPIMFWDTYTDELYVVNRSSVVWKMFTVGRTATKRTARLTSNLTSIGYGEAADSNRRHTGVMWTWPSADYEAVLAYCTDGTGEADYTWTWEDPNTDHTQSQFSNGTHVGIWTTTPTAGANSWFAEYPNTPINRPHLCILIDPDFESSGQGTQNVGYLPT